MSRFVCGALMLVAVGFSSRSALAQVDKMYPVRGVTVSGTVTAMTPEKVTMDVGGNPREISVNEIGRLVFGDEPSELTKIRTNLLEGQVESALEDLKKLNIDSIPRDVVKQDVEYYRAYCMAKMALGGGGNPVAADAALVAFFRNNRGSYHAFEATELLGQLAVLQGNYVDAAKRFKFLGQAPWADYALRANVNEARALTAAKSYPEALEKYDSILASAESSPEVNRQKQLASVGRAVCLAETGKVDEGIQVLEKIVKDNDAKDVNLFARTYNALGQCYLKANKPKEARLAYLRTHLMFNNDGDAHAEALAHLATLWADANKADRAVAAKNLLRERYPTSPWAKGQ